MHAMALWKENPTSTQGYEARRARGWLATCIPPTGWKMHARLRLPWLPASLAGFGGKKVRLAHLLAPQLAYSS